MGFLSTARIPSPVLRVDKPAWWPSTVYARINAREERVVDWSSVGTLEMGLELRYGPRKHWQAMDDTNCERSGVPMIFRWGGPSAFYESVDKRIVKKHRNTTTHLSALRKRRQEFKHLYRNGTSGRTKCERSGCKPWCGHARLGLEGQSII
jgi:hypothetical protein